MNPNIETILNSLDEVKAQMKDNDYKVAVEALAELAPPPETKEYILKMIKLIPELELGNGGEHTINIAKEMIQNKVSLSDESRVYLQSLVANGSIHIELSSLAPAQKDELEKIKRMIYNISTKNTVSQVLDCHRVGSACRGSRRTTNLCSTVIIIGISLHQPPHPDSEPEEEEPVQTFPIAVQFSRQLRPSRRYL